jgi:UDP-N-acetylmuramoyl-tripeptide--D-alanyl-D-alanine ligase
VTGARIIAIVVALAATGLGDLRWLRVAQREHYLPGSAIRFALRWWGGFGPNRVLAAAAVAGVVLSPLSPFFAIAGALAIGAGPLRFPVRATAPGPVVWTTRLRTVAAVVGAVQVVVVAAAVPLGGGVPVSALVALLSPLAVDLTLAALGPLEDRKAGRFVAQARSRLGDVAPAVVAITGSYGKTTTKAYAAHLMRGAKTVVPTPASFNNRAGLSRAINEHLVPGTEVFIAEMGTYGPGEIAAMCAWCPPRIAAITAIGPVHLERFGDEDAIVRAKSEIFERAEVAVINVDDARLRSVADVQAARGKEVVRCSATDPAADVAARLVDNRLVVTRAGEPVAEVDAPDAPAGNVAVAVALALAVGTPVATVAAALPTLPEVANRRTATTLSTGAAAIDDTFNSNPAGCRAAVSTLVKLSRPGHKRVVVTPGMVELGPRQDPENRAFATEASRAATHLVVVGHTNRRSLLAGFRDAADAERAELLLAESHADAVDWVRGHTGPGDVVLYENQLPDHYP